MHHVKKGSSFANLDRFQPFSESSPVIRLDSEAGTTPHILRSVTPYSRNKKTGAYMIMETLQEIHLKQRRSMYLLLALFVLGWGFTEFKTVFAGLILGSLFGRSEEHTSELQSRFDLVCRLLLEKKN